MEVLVSSTYRMTSRNVYEEVLGADPRVTESSLFPLKPFS